MQKFEEGFTKEIDLRSRNPEKNWIPHQVRNDKQRFYAVERQGVNAFAERVRRIAWKW